MNTKHFIKTCEACNHDFHCNHMTRNVRWCPDCRPEQYRILQREVNGGLRRNDKKRFRKYLLKVLTLFQHPGRQRWPKGKIGVVNL